MKNLVTFLLLTAALTAQAKDFRTLDFGDSCEGLVNAEQALGSQYSGAADEKSVFAFHGSFQGWPVTVGYICPEGRFSSGTYILGRTSLSEAKTFFSELKRQLILEHGEPTADFASEKFQQRLEESVGQRMSDKDTYVCIWEKKGLQIHLSMSGPFGGEGWQTSVTFKVPREI